MDDKREEREGGREEGREGGREGRIPHTITSLLNFVGGREFCLTAHGK